MSSFEATEEAKEEFRSLLVDMLENGDGGPYDLSHLKIRWYECNKIWKDVTENVCKLAYRCYINNVPVTATDSKGRLLKFGTYHADSEFPERYEKVKMAVKEVHEQLDEKMTDLEKLLWIHDYLLDKAYYYDDPGTDLTYTAAGPLGLGYGVSSGFAYALQLLLEEEGISSEYITGEGHVWLVVNIDGKLYHVDPTWNQTNYKETGSIHTFFLRNDYEFLHALHPIHSAWNRWNNDKKEMEFYSISVEKSNSDWFLYQVPERMHYFDGYWYYKMDDKLVKGDIKKLGKEWKIIARDFSIQRISKDGKLYYIQEGEEKSIDLTKWTSIELEKSVTESDSKKEVEIQEKIVEEKAEKIEAKMEIKEKCTVSQLLVDESTGYHYRVTEVNETGGAVEFVKGQTNSSKTIMIPAIVRYGTYQYKVTSIGNRAFEEATPIEKIIIGRNIEHIEPDAFVGCRSLKSLVVKTKKISASSIKRKVFFAKWRL